jgi:hypothetical protein
MNPHTPIVSSTTRARFYHLPLEHTLLDDDRPAEIISNYFDDWSSWSKWQEKDLTVGVEITFRPIPLIPINVTRTLPLRAFLAADRNFH